MLLIHAKLRSSSDFALKNDSLLILYTCPTCAVSANFRVELERIIDFYSWIQINFMLPLLNLKENLTVRLCHRVAPWNVI